MRDSKMSKTNNFHSNHMKKQILSCSFNRPQVASTTSKRVGICVIVLAMNCDALKDKDLSLYALLERRLFKLRNGTDYIKFY